MIQVNKDVASVFFLSIKCLDKLKACIWHFAYTLFSSFFSLYISIQAIIASILTLAMPTD